MLGTMLEIYFIFSNEQKVYATEQANYFTLGQIGLS